MNSETAKRKRSRSPSYPAIDLREALKRARVLYDAEGEHPAAVDTILGDWGYEPKSGGGLVILAALKKFGLLVDEGTGVRRRARLSRPALEILLDEREDSTARRKLTQQAALKPRIHAELWEEYSGSLPSEKSLKHQLRFDRGFTDRGVAEFIPQFMSTLAYAKLVGGGKLSGEERDKPPQEKEGQMTPPTGTPTIQLSTSGTERAALQAVFPLTRNGWQQMQDVLKAMKPALVASEDETQTEAAQEEPSE